MWTLLIAAALADPSAAIAARTGQPVAAVVAKGTWCQVCVAELARLDPAAVARSGGSVIGVFAETEGAVRAAGQGLPVPVVADPDGAWVRDNGFTRPGLSHPLPGVLFYDRCGEPVARLDGRTPGRSQASVILETLAQLAAAPCEGRPQS
ncbi:MAG: hypothetical protein ACI8PZ_004833 [Myxococcota bacterium]|jgi:hypothetical protein